MKDFRRVILAMFAVLMLTAAFGWAQVSESEIDPESQAGVAQQPAAPPSDPRIADDQPQRKDPPGRAVRLQYMSGSVSFQPQGTGDWVAGSLNRPLTNADNLWTDKSSRAELNTGAGILRTSDETSLTLTNVSDNSMQVELHQGTLDLHVRHLLGGEIYEIDTPNMAFTIQKSGDYRFDVDPNGDATVVTVRKGEGDATGQGPAVRVKSDEQVRFTDSTSMTHTVAEAPPYDGFDSWCAVRDKREDSSLSARYVAEGTVGYEDLDNNGAWREVPPYGAVWVPTTVAPGWAPYQYGHWAWVEPWGWTWVDDAPWGYAPFHYGRWVYTGGYWGWAPGPVYVRPVYAPALVAWFGGPGWGVNIGFGFGGGFGWCPLGWGEPFFPWYRGSYGYFRSVNINIRNVNNYWGHPPNRFGQGGYHYANMRAFTAVPTRTVANGMPVRGTAIRVSGRDLANAPMGRVNVTPTRAALGAGRPGAMPPRSAMRPVVSRAANGLGRSNETGGNKPFAGRVGSANSGPERGVQRSSETASSMSGRSVPRPGSSVAQRPGMGNPQMARNVPRPGMGNVGESRGGMTSGPAERSVPRPPANLGSRGSETGFGQRPGMEASRNRPSTAVPRPSGPVRPASEYSRSSSGGYRSSRENTPAYRGGYGSPAYRGGSGNSPSYRGGASPSYGSPRNSAPPSYRGGSAPSYGQSAPSYHGGGGAPSYHGGGGAPSYHGGGGGGAPSSHGGGGGGGGSHGSSGGSGHSGHR
jgi:FecR protein